MHRCTRSLTPTGTAFTCKPGCMPTATRVCAHAHGDSTCGTPLAQPLGRFGAIIFILQVRKWRQGLVSLTGPRPLNWPILGSRLGLQVPDSEPPLWGCVWPQTFGLTSVTSEQYGLHSLSCWVTRGSTLSLAGPQVPCWGQTDSAGGASALRSQSLGFPSQKEPSAFPTCFPPACSQSGHYELNCGLQKIVRQGPGDARNWQVALRGQRGERTGHMEEGFSPALPWRVGVALFCPASRFAQEGTSVPSRSCSQRSAWCPVSSSGSGRGLTGGTKSARPWAWWSGWHREGMGQAGGCFCFL